MAKVPKKSTTTQDALNSTINTVKGATLELKELHKELSTQSVEKCVESVDLPAEKGSFYLTSEQTLDEIVAISQELGLYELDSNPLINSSRPIEAVESVQQESNTTVAPEAGIAVNASQSVIEASLPVGITISEPTNEAQYVKDGWDRPVPTKVVTIKKSYLRETVEETLYIANLGGALDTTFLPTMTCPFICRMLLPESKYQEYLERSSQIGYDESLNGYNEVLVKGVDRPTFWKNLVKVGNAGGFLVPNSQPTRAPQFTAKLLTRKPVADTIHTQLKPKKAIYTREELESFSIEDLHIIGGWFKLSFNSKQKYVKAIIESQESKL